jgi:hypothetical protein
MNLLTELEEATVTKLGNIAGDFSEIIGTGLTRKEDYREVVFLIHQLQNIIMAQAAGRAYPAKYRLLGEIINA